MTTHRTIRIMRPRATFDPLLIPCCPHCDNAIEEWMDAAIGALEGSLYLAHAECLIETEDNKG